MAKINKLRFINVNYNNNSMTIDDEVLNLSGKDTLINLRNGGGKSVLVQMCMAPFMNKRNRNMKDRLFESYFTTSNPTYILVEWKLDDNYGYLLTGMMVRKRQLASDEDSKEKLEIINFVHEYKNSNKYDIENFPFIETQGSVRKLRGFVSSKKIFEELKKDNNFKFNYYDMNTQSKRYFDLLREYKIDNKEWENIIRKINLKESGLSELFNSAKNESGLVKEWFIPAIEDKLNKDENRIRKYNELTESYIKQYKNNKSKIDSKNNMEKFMELSETIKESAEEYKETLDIKGEIENNIANLIKKVHEDYKEKEESILSIEKDEDELREKLDGLNYEEVSRDIYEKLDNKAEKDKVLSENNESIKLEKGNLDLLKRKKNILECARIHAEYQRKSEEVQKIEHECEALNKSNEEKIPRINDLGYSINIILEEEQVSQNDFLIQCEEEEKALLKEENEANAKRESSIKSASDLNAKKAVLDERIKKYDVEEEKFSKIYGLEISRNLEGYYKEDDIINFSMSILNGIEDGEKNLTKLIKSYDENDKTIKSKHKLREDKLIEEKEISVNLINENKKLADMEVEIEKRKEIIKIIDFSESKLFDKEEILQAFSKKIESLNLELKKNSNKLEVLNKELEKLESGRVLELPQEIEGALQRKGINILYGMEWLKNNGFSQEKNRKLVENNSFIPYSLIVDEKELDILRKEGLDVFTNFPIPLIKRSEIEKQVSSINGVIDENDLSFYMVFNEGLLDEDELNSLMDNIKYKKERVEAVAAQLKEEEEYYSKKKNEVYYSPLDKDEYLECKNIIHTLEEENNEIIIFINDLRQELIGLNEENQKLSKDIESLKKNIEVLKKKNVDFNELHKAYDNYKKNKDDLQKAIVSIQRINEEKLEVEKQLKEIKENVYGKRELINTTRTAIKDIENTKLDYEDFKEGNKIKRDKEDLLAEYKALTKNISESEKSLRERLKSSREVYNETESYLIEKTKNYNLKDYEYIDEIYNTSKEREVENNIALKENQIESLKNNEKEIEKIIAVLNRDLDVLYKKLRTKLNKEEPLKREEVFNKDFALEKSKIKAEEKNLKELKKDQLYKKRILENNQSALKSYSNVEIAFDINIEIDYDTLDDYRGKLERDFRNINKDIDKKENLLFRTIVNVESEEAFKDAVEFSAPLNTLKELVDKPIEVLDYLKMLIESFNIQLQKLNTDIHLIDEEEQNLLDSMLEYIKDIHENIAMIDENSSIMIGDKRRKMLDIIVSDFEENKDLYKVKLRDYIESIRDNAIKILEENKNIEEYINNNITTIKLYDEVINIESIAIKLYKVEENKQIKITWREVAKNSGGEGFLSAFVILSSLLSYTRKDSSDIFSKNEGSKVLIMDNPFAQTNAEHLLKPLMEIAKKSNTQLICLSGLGGDSIYNRFENIYVLNLVKSSINVNKSYLKAEHKVGEESPEKQSLISSRFDVEDVDQMRLF